MTTEKCIHHWRIAEPDGRERVDGYCLKCGAQPGAVFRSAFESTWDRSIPVPLKASRK